MKDLNLNVTSQIQSFRSPFIDQIMVWLSLPGYFPYKALFVLIPIIILLYIKKYKEAAIALLVFIGTVILEIVIKHFVLSTRPSGDLISYIYRVERSNSFPSGHVLFYTSYFGFLIYLINKHMKNRRISRLLSVVLGLLIIGIGISRIYLGTHWFTDVLGGYVIGALWLVIAIMLYNFWLRYEANKN